MNKSGNFFLQYINGELNNKNIKENYLLKLKSEKNEIEREITLIMKNEMNLIVGATGSGKSKIGAYIIRQLINPKCDEYFIRNDDHKLNQILVIDTEMDNSRIINWYIETPFFDLDEKIFTELVDKENRIYGKKLKGIGNEKELFDEIKKIVYEFKNTSSDYYKIILLDSVFSLTENTNDPNNNKLGNELNNLLTGTTSILISHTNHKSQHSTSASGSLGTSLERCSSIILNISKESELSTDVIIKKTKSHPEDENIKIRFNQKKHLHRAFDKSEKEIFIYDSLYIIEKKEKQETINQEAKALKLIKNYTDKYGEKSNEMLKKNLVNILSKEMSKSDKTIYKYLDNLEKSGHIYTTDSFVFIK